QPAFTGSFTAFAEVSPTVSHNLAPDFSTGPLAPRGHFQVVATGRMAERRRPAGRAQPVLYRYRATVSEAFIRCVHCGLPHERYVVACPPTGLRIEQHERLAGRRARRRPDAPG